ncbi:MAG: endonuclease/exonuclease/phosphatase family protein [Anaerolineales bacterium]|nr:endonuclease/exonuclease/phosphatase family protein [Anaerolineales bacterium]
MKKSLSIAVAFAIMTLFFIQSVGTLIESIYILDLMNSKLDEKALGVLFLFTPALLIPFYKKYPRLLTWLTFAVLFMARGLLPNLNTADRMLAAGLSTFASLSLLLLLLKANLTSDVESRIDLWSAAGLGLAVGLSVLLRTVGDGLEYSLIPAGAWLGWGLGIVLGLLLTQLSVKNEARPVAETKSGLAPILGLLLVLTMLWFAFSAPAVIARWTEANYTLIVIVISLLSLGWVAVAFFRADLLDRITPGGLVIWNLLFTAALTATLMAQRVPFPPTPDSAPAVVTAPTLLQHIPLGLLLLLFPVLFVDMRLFVKQIRVANPTSGTLISGVLLGGLIITLLIFAHIFTNVWGYVKPISPFFRDKFWLSYFLIAGLITLFTLRAKRTDSLTEKQPAGSPHWGWALLLVAIFGVTVFHALPAPRVQVIDAVRTSIMVMTFNTQQSNDDFGERSFAAQLELIRQVSPDILALQESDSTRISLNNNDYVLYFAENLGYYSYYGPTTVTGTYGTAILSKYPLQNTRTAFTYSDKDETGIAEAEIEVDGARFTIYNVHPDGSDTSMLAFAESLLARSQGKPYVIALGDFNLRDYEEAYQRIDSVYTNVWTSTYPTEISDAGVDMSGENRIDHIFLSDDLTARNPVYILPPESTTDHPVHWTEITWDAP